MGADCGAVDTVVAAVRHDLGQRNRDRLPDPGFTPSPEPPIDRIPAAIFGRHVAPWSAAAKPPQDAVDNRTVLFRASASTTVLRLDGQQALQNPPFCFSEIAPAQACLQKTALNQPAREPSMTLMQLARERNGLADTLVRETAFRTIMRRGVAGPTPKLRLIALQSDPEVLADISNHMDRNRSCQDQALH